MPFGICGNGTLFHSLRWRHNDHDGVSKDQPHGCLLNRLFRGRSKKTSKLRVTGLCVGNSPGPVNSPHKGPVTRKILPFDDVIMFTTTWKHMESETKLPTFYRRHFQMHFRQCKCLRFDKKNHGNLIPMVQLTIRHYSLSLWPGAEQAQANDDIIYWRIFSSLVITKMLSTRAPRIYHIILYLVCMDDPHVLSLDTQTL